MHFQSLLQVLCVTNVNLPVSVLDYIYILHNHLLLRLVECGITPPLNLPAPGRRQTLYIDFMSLQSPVFLLNSRKSHFSAASSGFVYATKPYRGTPYPEVTGSTCLVP